MCAGTLSVDQKKGYQDPLAVHWLPGGSREHSVFGSRNKSNGYNDDSIRLERMCMSIGRVLHCA